MRAAYQIEIQARADISKRRSVDIAMLSSRYRKHLYVDIVSVLVADDTVCGARMRMWQ